MSAICADCLTIDIPLLGSPPPPSVGGLPLCSNCDAIIHRQRRTTPSTKPHDYFTIFPDRHYHTRVPIPFWMMRPISERVNVS
jgi:hypothetical protein